MSKTFAIPPCRWVAAVLMLLMALPVLAQDGGQDQAQTRQQLEAARQQLQEVARKVAELSGQLGEDQNIQIRRFGSQRPMLGFVMGTNEAKGVRLEAVTPEGPAAKAGLHSGDVLTHVNGQELTAPQAAARIGDAKRALSGLEVGQQVALGYEREGQARQVTVAAEMVSPFAWIGGADGQGFNIDLDMERLGADLQRSLGNVDIQKRIRVIGPMLEESIRFDAWRWQGLRLAPLDAELGRYFGTQQGVLVLKAEGENLGDLQSGDVIQAIAGETVADPRAAMRQLAQATPGERVTVSVLRDKRRTELALTAPEQPDVLHWLGEPPVPPEPPAPPEPADAPPPPPPPPPPPVPATDKRAGVVI